MNLTLSIYSLVMRALQPWLVRKLKRRALQEPLYAQAMDERFGVYTSKPWAAAFVPLVFALPSGRRLRALVISASVVVVLWLPFVLGASGTIAAGARPICCAVSCTNIGRSRFPGDFAA